MTLVSALLTFYKKKYRHDFKHFKYLDIFKIAISIFWHV